LLCLSYVTKMFIDEERLFTLTTFVSTRGIVRQTKSDHNILYCNFNLIYKNEVPSQRRQEMFNLENVECQEVFTHETENTSKFTDIFKAMVPFKMKTKMFQRSLNQSVRKCFKKVRIKKFQKKSELSKMFETWSKLKIFINNSDCENSSEWLKLDSTSLTKSLKIIVLLKMQN
jgi:hypothetical protein